ncbi:MAG: glycoside hydrolase family 88 protein [Prevotella sp.]|nr:glycoside hydrolase family 88 protein [Prevotella sp.]
MKRVFLLLVAMLTGISLPAEEPQHYSEWMTSSEMKRTPHPYNLNFSSWWPQWSYQVGTEIDAMLDVYKTYNNNNVYKYLAEYPKQMINNKGEISGYSYNDFNLDNVRTAHFLMRWYQMEPQEKDLTALQTLFRQLENQPRTQSGVWWHKAIYANQVWLDGIFMGLPFYTLAAPTLRPGEEQTYYNDAVDQISKTDGYTYDEETRLWKHAWDETHSIFWADPKTGLSQHTWGRALGWFSMAMVEVLDALPEDYERRAEVIEIFQAVMQSVVEYQDAESGVWYDVMDVDDPRNYLEATCSSMFAYCLLKGIRMGYLDNSYMDAAIKAYKGVVKEFVVENSDGTISLTKCCEVSGLGPENKPQRDGSFEYYMSENVRDNDPKGIGPFIWASLEAERLGFTVQNLFDQSTTDIRAIEQSDNLQSDDLRFDNWYDLSGRKINSSTAASVRSGLPAVTSGIYIHNGRKIIIRR